MYKSFFGLKENPFNVNPDPRYLFLTKQIEEALSGLMYGIQTRKGFITLTGEVGTGKTTLVNRLLDWLHLRRTSARPARAPGPIQRRAANGACASAEPSCVRPGHGVAPAWKTFLSAVVVARRRRGKIALE